MATEILQRQSGNVSAHHDGLEHIGGGSDGRGSAHSLRLLARALRGDYAQSALTEVAVGDLVRVREGVWRVMEVRTFARPVTRVLRLIGADALNRWQPCTLLEPFDRPRRLDAAQMPRVVSRARWMRTCAALIAASPPPGCPATIADAEVTLMPHQIDPVLAVLRGRASRLLLADAVGLGKTIQAALLLRELRARGCADRVLILVPSGLRDQWRQELSHRTGLRGDIIDAEALAARTRDLPPDVNPWSLSGILIVSLDFLKQPSVLHGASTIVWDILIIDEAHNLNAGTDRLAAADLLARHSRHVVLLTATPHHGSDDAFATLCAIGQMARIGEMGRIGHTGVDAHAPASEPESDPIAIFRRTRQTMGLARTRKVHVLRVTPTKQERWLHTLLARYVSRVEHERIGHDVGRERIDRDGVERERAACERGDLEPVECGRTAREGVDSNDSVRPHAATLAMSVLLKRASSSAASLERSLRRRLALLDGLTPSAPDGPAQPQLPFGDDGDDDLADGEPSHVLGAPGLRSARIERAWLTLLIEASRNASRTESKPRALARLLRRCREPALIYTEYRDTLTHLARTLFGGPSIAGSENASRARNRCLFACPRPRPRSAVPRSRSRLPMAPGGGRPAPSEAPSSYAMLHGGLSVDARRGALARFASGDARILLTTDAAGEGLNLHHRCRLVINVELPWNPNRLEQRIGRIDRLGQTRTVHAIHLVAAGTAEEQMLSRLTGRIAQIAATLGDAPAVLRASCDNAAFDALTDADAESVAGKNVSAGADAFSRAGARLEARADRDSAAVARGDAKSDGQKNDEQKSDEQTSDEQKSDEPKSDEPRTDGLSSDACRSVSTAAADVSERLLLLRTMRARASRPGGRRQGDGTHASRCDPLIGLDERAPLIAVTRRRRRRFDATEFPAPGIICLWRTRVHRYDGDVRGQGRLQSTVLTVIHVACEAPRFADRKAVAAFVSSTLERCRSRVQSLLDSELALARERLDAAEGARIERLARRDDAIAAAMTAMLRSRAASNGSFQPLLFEDIATEKTKMTGAADESWRPWRPGLPGAAHAKERVASSLALVLVRR